MDTQFIWASLHAQVHVCVCVHGASVEGTELRERVQSSVFVCDGHNLATGVKTYSYSDSMINIEHSNHFIKQNE